MEIISESTPQKTPTLLHCWTAMANVLHRLELWEEPRVNVLVWPYGGRIEVDVAENPKLRRWLKSQLKFQIPAWLVESAFKWLEAKISEPLGYGSTQRYHITIVLNGALVCSKVGEIECEPPESQQREAERLSQLTPEEALAYVREQAEQLRQPTIKPRYSCTVAGTSTSEHEPDDSDPNLDPDDLDHYAENEG